MTQGKEIREENPLETDDKSVHLGAKIMAAWINVFDSG